MLILASALLLTCSPPAVDHLLTESLRVQPGDAEEGQRFGSSVDVHGNVAVIGTQETTVGLFAGSAYLVDVTTGDILHKLIPGDLATADYFGAAVAINGTVVAVGASGADDNGTDSGAVYVFDIATGTELAKLLPSDGVAEARFGQALALDGQTLLVGAERDDDNGAFSGSAYVFDISTGQQLFKFAPSDLRSGDLFGSAVALSGTRAIVGAYRAGINPRTGTAYLFDTSTGQQIAKLAPSDAPQLGEFGRSVAIEGGLALVGGTGSNPVGSDSGAAYLIDANTGQELNRLFPADGFAGMRFGSAVALSDGRAFIGALRARSPQGPQAGAPGSVLVYDISRETRVSRFFGSDVTNFQGFGEVLAVDGETSVHGVGAIDVPFGNVGAAYIFRGPFGANYCGPAVPNSSGLPARIHLLGSPLVSLNQIGLVAADLPDNQVTLFLGSRSQAFVPLFGGSQGNLCLGGNLARFTRTGEVGRAVGGLRRVRVLLDRIPEPPSMNTSVAPGETWYFSAWFRDGASSNFSDAVGVIFR